MMLEPNHPALLPDGTVYNWSANPQLTAIAIIAADGTFPDYQTVKMDCGWRKFKRKVLS